MGNFWSDGPAYLLDGTIAGVFRYIAAMVGLIVLPIAAVGLGVGVLVLATKRGWRWLGWFMR